jgi:hypothetical protein
MIRIQGASLGERATLQLKRRIIQPDTVGCGHAEVATVPRPDEAHLSIWTSKE